MDRTRQADERGKAVLVITRNNLHLTKLTVRSVLDQDIPVRLFIVDNNSTDGTTTWLMTKDFPTIFCPKQLSLSTCWNFGIRTAFLEGHNQVLVLNNDVELRPDTYRHLLAHGGPFVTCVSVGTHKELRYPDAPTSESPHPDFSCFMIRKECYEKVGKFDESYYPAWLEDNDYHVRMHRAGMHAVSIDVPFLHHSASTIKHADPISRAEMMRCFSQNKNRFFEKYGCYPATPEYDGLFA